MATAAGRFSHMKAYMMFVCMSCNQLLWIDFCMYSMLIR